MDKKKIQIAIAAGLSIVLAMLLYQNFKKVSGRPGPKTEKDVIGVAEKVRPLFEAKKEDVSAADEVISERDPFSKVTGPVAQAPQAISGLELTGITTNAKGKPMALISGEIVSVGSRVGGCEVISISNDKVELCDQSGETRVLKME